MKTRIITLQFLLLINLIGFCQDIITYKNGTAIKAKVVEVTPVEVKFKRYDNLDGPLYTVSKSDLIEVRYESGLEDSFAQQAKPSTRLELDEKADEVLGYDRIKYNGPRAGFTIFTDGASKEALKMGKYGPWMTQIGWQFETRIFTTEGGTSGLIEWVLLFGGIEKGLFKPSASMLFGVRGGKRGFEFGLGPSLSTASLGMAFAVGGSIKSGKIYVPINLAFVPSVYNEWNDFGVRKATGARISLLVGFNTRVH